MADDDRKPTEEPETITDEALDEIVGGRTAVISKTTATDLKALDKTAIETRFTSRGTLP